MLANSRSMSSSTLDEFNGSSLLAALPGFTSRAASPLPRPLPMAPIGTTPSNNQDLLEELRQAKREIEVLKTMDPFHAADMAIELQMEKMRLAEAKSARDSAVQRLSSAYDSIKDKALTINRLQAEITELQRCLGEAETRVNEAVECARAQERMILEEEMHRLRESVRNLSDNAEARKCETPPDVDQYTKIECSSSTGSPFSGIEESSSFLTAVESSRSVGKPLQTIANDIDHFAIGPRPHSVSAFHGPNSSAAPCLKLADNNSVHKPCPRTGDPTEMVQARFAILATLPVPDGIPDDVLNPIMIPSPFTIHEFLGNTAGSLRNSLSGYRVFHDKITTWCPDREEHGYFLTPLYKCTTKLRVPTAHSWSEVDPRGRMTKPTECFYNREGKWYYAGQYIALCLDDLSTKEWEALDQETTAMLVKETLAGRKNTSPTVHYEVSQLYAAGALKVACVGLQCVGFNIGLYRTIMEQATKCHQSGRWKTGWGSNISDFTALEGSDSNYNCNLESDGNQSTSSLLNFM